MHMVRQDDGGRNTEWSLPHHLSKGIPESCHIRVIAKERLTVISHDRQKESSTREIGTAIIWHESYCLEMNRNGGQCPPYDFRLRRSFCSCLIRLARRNQVVACRETRQASEAAASVAISAVGPAVAKKRFASTRCRSSMNP